MSTVLLFPKKRTSTYLEEARRVSMHFQWNDGSHARGLSD